MNKIPSEPRAQVPVLPRKGLANDLDLPSICLTWRGLPESTTLHSNGQLSWPSQQSGSATCLPLQPYSSILSLEINAVGVFFHQSIYHHHQIIIRLFQWLLTNVCLLSWIISSMRVRIGQFLLTIVFYQLARFLTHSRHLINCCFFKKMKKRL